MGEDGGSELGAIAEAMGASQTEGSLSVFSMKVASAQTQDGCLDPVVDPGCGMVLVAASNSFVDKGREMGVSSTMGIVHGSGEMLK